MSVDSSLVSASVKDPSVFRNLLRAGIDETYFTDEWQKAWKWLRKMKKEHGVVPSREVFQNRYPNLELHKVKKSDVGILLNEIRQRRKYMDFLLALDQGARCSSPEDLDAAISQLQGDINRMAFRGSNNGLVDLFSPEGRKRILKDQEVRRRKSVMGIPTGLKRFDMVTGGLQRGRLITIIGRPGTGKSWLDLLFVASGVTHGAKVGLYPLEMTLEETAMRLFSIFSMKMFGAGKVLRNSDLMNGRVSPKKIVKFLNALEDKFSGQLYVADIGSMQDPYTVERVEAEQEVHRFDMQWIDYLTLMKAPGVGREGQEDHTTVKALSNGCKQIAVRHNTVMGVSAQVSRSAISGNILLPRLEHIAYGDAIGQDSDHVVPIARKPGTAHLYYGMVKNRHGAEIPKTRIKSAFDEGLIEDEPDALQEDDEED